jgi:hypothetical protein
MHGLVLLPALLLGAPSAKAPASPEAFLALIPPIPVDPCAARTADQERFQEKLKPILASLEERISRQEQADQEEEKQAGAAMQKKLRASSPKVDREAVRKMSPQEKMAFAMAQMGSMDPKVMAELNEKTQAAREGATLTPELKLLATFDAQYEALLDEYQERAGAAGGRGYTSRSQQPQEDLCPQFAPRYVKLLQRHLAAIKAALPSFKHQAEARRRTLGVKGPGASSVPALEAIRSYVERLEKVHLFSRPGE